MKNIISVFAIGLLTLSCTNDSESDLIDNETTTTVSYTEDVKPIMESNCVSCHGNTPSNGASVSLNTYDNVKNAILNNALINRISKDQSDPELMPLGGSRLPQTTIDKIAQWETEDFPQ